MNPDDPLLLLLPLFAAAPFQDAGGPITVARSTVWSPRGRQVWKPRHHQSKLTGGLRATGHRKL